MLEAAQTLGFEASPLARSLRTRTTYTVGFVVPDVSSPFYAAALKGAQRVLEAAGYRVMLMDSEQDVESETAALRTLLNHRVDGLLLATVGLSRTAFEQLVGGRGTPCVFIDTVVPGAGLAAVMLENGEGIRLLVDHLVGHGHSRIACLAGSQQETAGRERLDAFVKVAAEHSLAVPAELVRTCRWHQGAAREATLALLALERRPTAVVASSVELALGCLAACREQHLRLPDDLALATFDDAYFSVFVDPSLTAIAYDPIEVGRSAAALLVEAMGNDEVERREVRIPVRLITRRSCGCEPA